MSGHQDAQHCEISLNCCTLDQSLSRALNGYEDGMAVSRM